MNLPLAIEKLRGPTASYRLTDAHATTADDIIGWDGPGAKPTQDELNTAWATLLAEQQVAAQMEANAGTLQTKLEGALTNLQAYRALATPTAAQTTAAVKLLCGAVGWLIRLQLKKLDAAD